MRRHGNWRRSLAVLVAVALSGTTLLHGQDAPAIDVASMRLAADDGTTTISPLAEPLFSLHNASLMLLLTMAYDVPRPNIEHLPGWDDSTSYDIRARNPGGAGTTEQARQLLLQQLLAERLHLAVHRETRMVKGFVLQVAKSGAKLKEAHGDAAAGYVRRDGITGQGLDMAALATMLRNAAGGPVVDRTSISGKYDVDLRFAAKESQDSALPSVFVAIEEQMGLKLVAQAVPQDFLVVDHVDMIPVEN